MVAAAAVTGAVADAREVFAVGQNRSTTPWHSKRSRASRAAPSTSRANDIDTDRIIPARFMKWVTFDGLGESLVLRRTRRGAPAGPRHPLNDPRFEGATILVSA